MSLGLIDYEVHEPLSGTNTKEFKAALKVSSFVDILDEVKAEVRKYDDELADSLCAELLSINACQFWTVLLNFCGMDKVWRGRQGSEPFLSAKYKRACASKQRRMKRKSHSGLLYWSATKTKKGRAIKRK